MPASPRKLAALSLIALGFLWLSVSLGLLSGALLGTVARLWPVLLIGVGLDILLQRRVLALPYTALVFVGLLAYGLFAAPGAGTPSEKQFREPLGRTERAEVELDLSSATTTLQALADGEDLVAATIRDVGSVRFQASGNRTKRVRLEKTSRRTVRGEALNRHWDIALARSVPLSLAIEGGSGAANLDLRELELSGLDLELASGATTVTLPATGERFEADLEGGSGRLRVDIGIGTEVELDAELGSGAATFGFDEAGMGAGYAELKIDSGSGSVTFDVPERGNVRLEVKDDASGALVLPDWLEQLEGDTEQGVWQTEGFDPERGQVLINVEDRGSGAITLR